MNTRLITPFFQRPEPPLGEKLFSLARAREIRERWLVPLRDDVPSPSHYGVGKRGSGYSGVRIQGRTGRPRSVTPEQEAQIVQFRSDGRTVREIVAMVGCTDGCVRHVLATASEEA